MPTFQLMVPVNNWKWKEENEEKYISLNFMSHLKCYNFDIMLYGHKLQNYNSSYIYYSMQRDVKHYDTHQYD